jgi:two-component sensor histidine kinase
MDRLIDRLPSLKRLILSDHALPVSAVWSGAAVVLPLSLRLALDGGAAGVPFVTFFPAVLLTALVLGWRWAAAVTVGSAIAANRLLIHSPLDMLDATDFLLGAMFIASCAMLVASGDLARKLVRQIEAAKDREETLKHELIHRVKNMLATVRAMEAMTARYSDPESYRTALTGRLDALQRVTSLLAGNSAEDRELYKVLDSSLAPFRTPENLIVNGPSCSLPGDACLPLALALHELCTNAVKYGALSVPEGQVSIRWTLDGATGLLDLVWSEHGGPPVEPPTRQGMGTQLLRRQRALGAVSLEYASDGLICRMTLSGAAAI